MASSLLIIVTLWMCGVASALAQSAAATKRLDVFLLENKFVTVDRPIVSVTSTKPDVVRVQQSGAENQFEVRGLLLGDALVSVFTQEQRIVQGRPEIVEQELLFYVTVSPAPSRIYINVPESKRLSFKDPIEEAVASTRNIVRVLQPGGADRILLLQAERVGQTTVTVISGGNVYRYYVSTFANRGADVLDLENEFARKGYRFLRVTFQRDQAVLAGTVPTQEELDDAVRLVKQYTPYVIIRAVVGTTSVQQGESEEERVIIAAIKALSRSPNVIVRVKFTNTPAAGAVTTSTELADGGTPATGDTADDDADQGAEDAIAQPDEETQANIERIYLFGEVENDLEESRVIRVARTYTQAVHSFIKVKDPYQVRFHLRTIEVNESRLRDMGIRLQGANPADRAELATAVVGTRDPESGAPIDEVGDFLGLSGVDVIADAFESLIASNLVLAFSTDVEYSLRLLDTYSLGSELQYAHLFTANDQAASFFSGDLIPFLDSTTVGAGGASTQNVDFISVGLTVVVAPLNATQEQYGNEELTVNPQGDGVQTNFTTPSTFSRFPEVVEDVGQVEESNKYVDENEMISVFAGVTTSTSPTSVSIGGNPVPQVASQASVSRAYLRDMQSLVVSGIFSERQQMNKNEFPFLSKIPVLGWLFRQEDNGTGDARSELYVVLTPEIVRFQDAEDKRMKRPEMPELEDQLTRLGFVPTMEPVRYEASGTKLRDVTPNEGDLPQPLLDETGNTDLLLPTLKEPEVPIDTIYSGKDSKTPLAEIPAITDTLP